VHRIADHSVTTALDEYRHQLQAEHDDRVGVEEEGQLADDESVSTLNSASSEIIENAAELERGFKEHRIGETLNGDVLRRRVKDGANLAGTARAQLRMRPIVMRWLRASVKALRATPLLIRMASRAIKIGVDVATPFGEWWLETQRDILAGLGKKVTGFADALEEAGKRLARHTETGQAQRQRDPAVVAAEADVRRMLLNGRSPPPALAALVQVVDLRGKPDAENRIARPEDLALLVNLEDLRVFHTNLTIDQVIGPLSKLSRLRNLQIVGDPNVHQIGKLTGLTSLAVNAIRPRTPRPSASSPG
jgi:hypothetical protein